MLRDVKERKSLPSSLVGPTSVPAFTYKQRVLLRMKELGRHAFLCHNRKYCMLPKEKVRLLGLLLPLLNQGVITSIPLCVGKIRLWSHLGSVPLSRRGLHFESFILVNAGLGRPKGLTDLKYSPLKYLEGLIWGQSLHTSFLESYRIQAH